MTAEAFAELIKSPIVASVFAWSSFPSCKVSVFETEETYVAQASLRKRKVTLTTNPVCISKELAKSNPVGAAIQVAAQLNSALQEE